MADYSSLNPSKSLSSPEKSLENPNIDSRKIILKEIPQVNPYLGKFHHDLTVLPHHK